MGGFRELLHVIPVRARRAVREEAALLSRQARVRAARLALWCWRVERSTPLARSALASVGVRVQPQAGRAAARHLILYQRRASLRIATPSRLYTLISTTSGPTDGVHLTPDCKRTDHYGRKIQ